jgi:hypothetical protein
VTKLAATRALEPTAKKFAKRSELGASIDGYLARLDGPPRAT